MTELQLLREISPEPVEPAPAGRAAARAAFLERIAAAERRGPRRRRRWTLPAAGIAATAAVAAAVFLSVGSGGEDTATAAAVLRKAAAAARAQAPLAPGDYLYVKSVSAYLATSADDGFSVLVPHVREIWLGAGGGQLHETSGEPTFLSERDRERWIAAGRPELPGGGSSDMRIPSRPLDLPTDPDALFERLRQDAEGRGNYLEQEMFALVGNALRETAATPAQRAALYEVAARIPGVELVGDVTDPAGRPGIGVAMDDEVARIRHTLVFDPSTYVLLAEEEAVLPDNAFDYSAGTVIGHATYLTTAVVGSPRERPKP